MRDADAGAWLRGLDRATGGSGVVRRLRRTAARGLPRAPRRRDSCGDSARQGSRGGCEASAPRQAAPVPAVGKCLQSAYGHERTGTPWTVSNTAEHDIRTRNDAVDGLMLPCKQGVPGSSPGVGSVSSQFRGQFALKAGRHLGPDMPTDLPTDLPTVGSRALFRLLRSRPAERASTSWTSWDPMNCLLLFRGQLRYAAPREALRPAGPPPSILTSGRSLAAKVTRVGDRIPAESRERGVADSIAFPTLAMPRGGRAVPQSLASPGRRFAASAEVREQWVAAAESSPWATEPSQVS